MGDEFIEEIDEVLSDVLSDVDSTSSAETERDVTFGQSVSVERQTAIVDDRIDQLAADLDVPAATVDLAKSLRDQYRGQRGDPVGTALELVAASCLYCAVKVTEVPLDPTDFVTADDIVVTRKALLRRSKDIASIVGLDPSAFFGSEQYVDRYCDTLDVTDAVNESTREIIEITEESGQSSGKSPTGWAAAAVYNAFLNVGEKRTQQELSRIANVPEVTDAASPNDETSDASTENNSPVENHADDSSPGGTARDRAADGEGPATDTDDSHPVGTARPTATEGRHTSIRPI